MTSGTTSSHCPQFQQVCGVDLLLSAMSPTSLPLRTDRYQPRHSEQVVGAGRKIGLYLGAGNADYPALPHPADGLEPAKDLLDALAGALAHPIAGMPRGTSVQSRRHPPIDPGDVRPDPVLAKVLNEPLAVITLVRNQRLGVDALPAQPSQQLLGDLRLARARVADQQIRAQSRAVLHECMPAKAQLGRLPIAPPHQLRLRIRAALVRLVRAPLALEVHHPGAVPAVLGPLAVLLQALEARPALDQRRVHREVLGRQQPVSLGQAQHLVEEVASNIGLNQPLAQTREVGLIQPGIIQTHVQEPAEQQVVVQLLAERPIRSHRVQRDQQLALEQPFRSNRGAAGLAVHLIELRTDRQ